MDITGAVIVFAFTILGGIAIVYTIAHQKLSNFEKDKRDFQNLAGKLNDLEVRVQNEANQWPIYARPLLFTEVDHESQIRFAEAQKSIVDGHYHSQGLETIVQLPIKKPALTAIPENVRIIQTGNQFRKLFYSFADDIINLSRSIIAIRVNEGKIIQKKSSVRKNIANFKSTIEQANQRAAKFEQGASQAINSVIWAVQVAQDAHASAEMAIVPKTNSDLDDDLGELGYAIAEVYLTIGQTALKCFNLYIDSLLKTDRYELDLFMNLFQETTDHLKSILVIDDINGWKKLRNAKYFIDELPEKEMQAEDSLKDFREKQNLFESKLRKLTEIDFSANVSLAQKIQSDFNRYWTPFHENRTEWQSVLGSRQLPSIRLIQIKDRYMSSIQPLTELGILIKQSSLSLLISQLAEMLRQVESADKDVINLKTEYQINFDAENLVRSLMSQNGRAFAIIGNVHKISTDADKDITEICLKLVETYRGYYTRLERVRGANFPELVAQCGNLIIDSEKIINDQRSRVILIQEQYGAMRVELEKSLNNLRGFTNLSPSFEPNYISRLEQLIVSCRILLESTSDGKYLSLRSLVGKMEQWLETGLPMILQTQDRIQKFRNLCGVIENKVIRLRTTLSNLKTTQENRIRWSLAEKFERIQQAEIKLEPIEEQWNRQQTFQWAEMSLQQAPMDCQDILSEISSIAAQLKGELEEVEYEKRNFQEQMSDIQRRTASSQQNIAPTDLETILELINIGLNSPVKKIAQNSLDLAETFAKEPINSRLRKSAQITINDYKRIINTEGGTYVEGDVNLNDLSQFNN